MSESMLAAVHAAATDGSQASKPQPPAQQPQTGTPFTIEGLRRDHPALVQELMAAGATAERERILGIEKIALPGHDALVAEMKADGKTTPDQAAGRILQAEKAAREQRAQALADADKSMAKVTPAPVAGAGADVPDSKPKASTPDGWKAEYAASEDLQGEFASADSYVAFKEAEKAGVARINRGRAA